MTSFRRRLLAVLFVLPACLARADDVSHDEILAAVRRGEIRPLAEIEASLRARLPGQVIKVEIERKAGVWIYEFKILDSAGRRLEVDVDAASGEIVERKRR